ncbi:hypothetical protein A3Q56_01877 [Intoshia linei]|uniref:Innexin n=1 Tax=Intoshia linei TaxID=1819745 RepID=A0A177B7S6_9BILA|nr:hypothetical protein A3Q56_01877 [Intoshia linei]
MQTLMRIATRSPSIKPKRFDDVIDRLNHYYTLIILIAFAFTVTMHSYVGKPIVCWAPKHFTGSHIKYSNSFCWVRNTYFLNFLDAVPKRGEPRDYILYYQWMPFVFMAQALLFHLPNLFWRNLNSKAGVDCDDILQNTYTFVKQRDYEKSEKYRNLIITQTDRFLTKSKKIDVNKGFVERFRQFVLSPINPFSSKSYGHYLFTIYMMTKCLYIINIVAQLFVLNQLFSNKYNLFGLDMFNAMISNDESGVFNNSTFPRVTMCDLKIRRLGNVQDYTLQCVLPVNLYTEKMYAFLYFWFLMVSVINIINLFVWLAVGFSKNDKRNYIKNHLHDGSIKNNTFLDQFIFDYLRLDGILLLKLIGHNTSSLTVNILIIGLWKKFLTYKIGPKRKDSDLNEKTNVAPLPPSDEKQTLINNDNKLAV